MNKVEGRIRNKIMQDDFAKKMGIRGSKLSKGFATFSMLVQPDMVNFHGVAHGGAIFALADAAFAAASNSHGSRALALNMEISFRHPVYPGETLTAEASEESLGRKTALYHIRVLNPQKKPVALCHGTVSRTGEDLLKPLIPKKK